jgi:hypothetical protein
MIAGFAEAIESEETLAAEVRFELTIPHGARSKSFSGPSSLIRLTRSGLGMNSHRKQWHRHAYSQ